MENLWKSRCESVDGLDVTQMGEYMGCDIGVISHINTPTEQHTTLTHRQSRPMWWSLVCGVCVMVSGCASSPMRVSIPTTLTPICRVVLNVMTTEPWTDRGLTVDCQNPHTPGEYVGNGGVGFPEDDDKCEYYLDWVGKVEKRC